MQYANSVGAFRKGESIMPVALNLFFDHANAMDHMGASENPLFVRNEQIQDNSAFSRLRFNARAAENRATVNEFLNAIGQDPQYAQYIGVAQSIFDVRLERAAPLTSKDILYAKTGMDLVQNTAVCKQFAGPNAALPNNFGTSFGQFCTLKGRVLQNAQDPQISGLLKEFIATEIFPQHVRKMCIDRGMPNEVPHMAELLQKTGVVERALDMLMENNDLKSMEFSTIMEFVTDQSALSMDVLLALRASDMPDVLQGTYKEEGILANIVKSDDCVNLLHTLTEAVKLNNVPLNKIDMFCQAIVEERRPVDTSAAQADALRSFLLNTEGAGRMQQLLQQQGLPENLAAPLGRHPVIVAGARTLLHDAVPPPAAPTREQAQQALKLAGEDFLERKMSEIREFVVMAADPPVQLARNPLSAESLPLYINALLEGQSLLQPLFDDSIALDAAFMTRVVDYKDALNSCSKGTQKDFGGDDATALHAGVLRLLLAVNGQQPSQDLLEKVLNKFGLLASEFSNITGILGPNMIDNASNVPFVEACTGGSFVLETIAKELVMQLPPNTLERMGIKGDTLQNRLFNYIQDNFQKETPFEEVSVRFRAFANSRGVVMPPMDPAVQATLEAREFDAAEAALLAARRDTQQSVLAEFFPPWERGKANGNSPMFYTAFDVASQNTDLSLLDPDTIKTFSMSLKAHNACTAWMEAHPGPITAEDLRPVIMASIAEALPGLQLIQAEDNALIRDVSMATGVEDRALLGKLADLARDTSVTIRKGMRPYNTDANVLGLLKTCMDKMQDIQRSFAMHPEVASDRTMDAMLRMFISLSGATVEERRTLFDNLSGPLGQSLAGGMMYTLNHHSGAHDLVKLRSALQMMGLLREHLGALLGIEVAHDPDFFSQSPAHISQISSHTMEFVNEYGASNFSSLEMVLAHLRPSMNPQDWDTLAGIGQRLISSGQGIREIEVLLHGNAPALLEASHANGGKELSPKQIWQAVTGKAAPSNLQEENFSARLHEHVTSIYQSAVAIACPDMPSDVLPMQVMMALRSGLSFPKLMELVKPHGRVDIGEITQDLNMSSLAGYGPENAFGLVTDFHRRHPDTTMRIETLDPQQVPFVTHPFLISNKDNVPEHPHFIAFMAAADAVCQSAAQKSRVLQAFSQAPLAMPRTISVAFPGMRLCEHGNFSVTATKQENNSVVVNIHSDPDLPIRFHEQIVIQTNGDHECTVFSMERQ